MNAYPGPAPHSARAVAGRVAGSRAWHSLVFALVALATLAALWLRLAGLTGWDGTLSVDEARLALAARGILQHGVPQLPSGWVYTRGLLASYTAAPFLAALGPSDFAARLPSVLAGAALVPVMYALGAAVAGRPAGLFAALYVVGYPPLVVWSRQAWFYALFVLLSMAALVFVVRAARGSRAFDRLAAGLFVGLTLFVHELGAFLLVPLGLLAVAGPRRGRLAAWIGLGLAFLALLWLAALVTRLRADTLVGPYGEVVEYFEPRLAGVPFRFYSRMLVDSRWLLLVAAVAGLPLALAGRRLDLLALWLALAIPFLHAVTIIPGQPQERYGLTFAPILAVLAAASTADWADRLVRPRWGQPAAKLAAAGLLVALLAAHQQVGRAIERSGFGPREGAWLETVRRLDIGAEDVVMTDVPTVMAWYVGGLDYWISTHEYQKYTYADGEARRDIHTGARLVRNAAEFRRLVLDSNHGGTVWAVVSGRSYQWGELVDDDLKSAIERAAVERINAGDGFRVYRLEP